MALLFAPSSSSSCSSSNGRLCWVWLLVLLSVVQNGLAFVARSPGRGLATMPALFQSNGGGGEEVKMSNRKNTKVRKVREEDRRTFLLELMSGPALMAGASLGLVSPPFVQDANARGLMQFPCSQPLVNNYHFMRAGTSLVEEEDGIWSTNPLFITNREYALSENGRKMAREQAQILKTAENVPTLAYHSLAAHGIDTADIIGQELQMGRERILPEFTYLDQRGIGGWNDGAVDEVLPAIYALDAYEASKEGVGGRPPPNTDGTANEALADQFVRLRQFLSLLESRTSGENVLLIFPDGTGPALLSCMIAGIPFNNVHCLDYAPGELRLDITRESVLDMYQQKKNDTDYLATLERGREKLIALREEQGKDLLSLKDQRAEENRMAMEKVYRDKEDVRLKREAAEYKLAREKRLGRSARLDKNKEAENEDGESLVNNKAYTLDVSSPLLAAAGGIGIAGVAVAVGMGPTDDKKDTKPHSLPSPVVGGSDETIAAATAVSSEEKNDNDKRNISSVTSLSNMDMVSKNDESRPRDDANDVRNDRSVSEAKNDSVRQSQVHPDDAANESEGIDKELEGLEVASKAMDEFLEKKRGGMDTSPDVSENNHVDGELEKLESAQKAMDGYLGEDDGYYDWLKVVADIANEPDGDDDDEFLQVEAEWKGVNGNTTIQY